MKPLPPQTAATCINNANQIETHLRKIFELIATPMSNSSFQVNGLTVSRSAEPDSDLIVAAMRTSYSLSASFLYSDHTGPLGRISLQQVTSPVVKGDAIFTITVDANGSATFADGTGFHVWDIGREIPEDDARRSLLNKILGSIIAALPAPPAPNQH